jgi:transposase
VPAPHPPEFRQRAVELARLRERPIREIAASLGISESCLRNWVAQADIDTGAKPGLSSDERAELAALRRDKRRLELVHLVAPQLAHPQPTLAASAASAVFASSYPLAISRFA